MKRSDRILVVVISALVGAFSLYFAGVPILGWLIHDWGQFLFVLAVIVGLYVVLLGAGVTWIFRGKGGYL